MLVLHFQERLGILELLHQFMEEVTHAVPSHIVIMEIEAQREVGVRGLQRQVDCGVDCGLHLCGIVLKHLGALE